MPHPTFKTATDVPTLANWFSQREHAAWRAFLDAHAALVAKLGDEMKRQSGLSAPDFVVLVGVSEAPGRRIRANELTTKLNWDKSRLSKQVKRMVERGLLTREECTEDARGSWVVLSDVGQRAFEQASPPHAKQVREWFVGALTETQLDQLLAIGTAIVSRLDGVDGSPADGQELDGVVSGAMRQPGT